MKILKHLASLKLAVFVLAALAIVTAIGTIVESRYDAQAAAKLVYKTFWTYSVLSLLALNLAAVMVDRWPWKRRHLPFLLAHIGIIILLVGAAVTMIFGIDGSLRVPIQGKSDSVVISDLSLALWGSFDGERFTKLDDRPVDFYKNSPQKNKVSFSVPEGEVRIVDYQPYVTASRLVKGSEDSRLGGAVRFQLQNNMANVVEWLVQRRPGESTEHQLGPASVVFGPLPKNFPKLNQVYLSPTETGKASTLHYAITYKDSARKTRQGVLHEGDSVDTGWMGFQLRLLRYFQHAEDGWSYEPQTRPTSGSMSAVQVEFNGKTQWLGEDDVIKLFTDNTVYFVRYGRRQIPLGFEVGLKEFMIDRYQGTMRAAAYKSVVQIPGMGEATISMNEPLKYGGYTLYQASFQEDPPGRPIASIFSVNYDPGRWIKYLGSLILSLGIVWLFYDRRKTASTMAPKSNNDLIEGNLW